LAASGFAFSGLLAGAAFVFASFAALGGIPRRLLAARKCTQSLRAHAASVQIDIPRANFLVQKSVYHQSVISRSRPALTPPLSVRFRHSRSNTSTEYSLPGGTQLSQVRSISPSGQGVPCRGSKVSQ
jgi:hypothetical protein